MKRATPHHDTELSFQTVIDAFTSQIAILDSKGVIIAINRAWRSFKSENGPVLANTEIGENYLQICENHVLNGLKEARDVAEAIRKIQNGAVDETYVEYPCYRKDIQYWYQVKISPFMMGQGKTIIIHQNITDKKTTQNRLLDSERLFRSIIEQSSEGVVIIDQSGKIIEWNEAEEKITGRPRESVVGRYMWDVQFEAFSGTPPPGMKASMKGMISDLLQTGTSLWTGKSNEVDIVRPDGSKATIENIIFPIIHDHGYFACSLTRDITEMKRIGSAHQVLAKKLENYVDYAPIIALIVTTEGKFIDVNPEAQKRLGYRKEEFLNMTMPDLIFKEDLEYAVSLFHHLVSKGHYSAEFRVKTKNKKELFLSANAVVLPDENLMILCNDITELKESQIKLQRNESFLNNILDNIPSAITVKEAKNFTYYKVNRLMENFLNTTNNELKGKTVYDFFSKEEADFLTEQDRLAFKENRIIDIPVMPTTLKNQEGRLFHQK
jgi:PAS domain S-box-containing protein